MNQYFGQDKREHGTASKTGVLLVNLGTPDAPTPKALRRYLKAFLSDPRVVEVPRLLWWCILNVIILNIRPRLRAKSYKAIWTPEGSPLMVFSRNLTTRLSARFAHNPNIVVKLAMCYSNPYVDETLRDMHEKGVTRLIVLPLYPQYSGSTTGAVFDLVTRALQKFRWVPQLRFINSYHALDEYVTAIATSIKEAWTQKGRSEKLLMSFHGVPTRYVTNGDPYHCFCQMSARLIANQLHLTDEAWQISFQSRFGRERWLEPATTATLKKLAADGIASIDVVCPGFAADCLETLEEIEIENREYFEQAGGKRLHYIPCLNDSDAHVDMLETIVRSHGAGWFECHTQSGNEQLTQAKERARALGATR